MDELIKSVQYVDIMDIITTSVDAESVCDLGIEGLIQRNS